MPDVSGFGPYGRKAPAAKNKESGDAGNKVTWSSKRLHCDTRIMVYNGHREMSLGSRGRLLSSPKKSSPGRPVISP